MRSTLPRKRQSAGGCERTVQGGFALCCMFRHTRCAADPGACPLPPASGRCVVSGGGAGGVGWGGVGGGGGGGGGSEHPSTQHESCRSQRPDCVSLSVHHVVRRVRGVHQHRHRGRVPVDGRSPWRRGQVSRDQWAGSLWPVLVATYSGPARPAPSALIAGTLRARTRREPTARSKGGPRLPRTRDLVAPGRVGAAACRRPRRAWASEKKKP